MTSRRPRISILLPTFLPHDAIGNDVLGMWDTFRAAGYDAFILAQFIHPTHQPYTRQADLENESTWQSEDNILIYHHALHWPLGESILSRTRNKVVIKYHNVTPARFYAQYSDYLYAACRDGAEATKRLAGHSAARFWADSTFNANELLDFGVPDQRCHVVAPCHRINDIAEAPLDAVTTGLYRQGRNLLFVGGLRPHKGHRKAIEVLAAYRNLTGQNYRLIFAGGSDPNLRQYEADLLSFAAELRVEQAVEFARGVSLAQLRAYYLTAGIFLCVSEHEGFCVPLVEAMYFRVPIIAWTTTAIKETCGDAGIAFEQCDPAQLASAIDECTENPAFARQLAEMGRARYEALFRPEITQSRLLELLAKVEHNT
jgi:glycosyltransferase involved in cell wall biosynthesis